MNQTEIILESGQYYHIYNRGINETNLFYQERNYDYFLQKYAQYLGDYIDTYAYCLLKNHFHLLVSVKDFEKFNACETIKNSNIGLHNSDRIISKKFSDFFNSYSKSINVQENRTGGLFETPFKRILVDNDKYFNELIWYLHFNPQKHGFTNDFRDYKHSSYQSLLLSNSTKLKREKVINWFGNKNEFEKFHLGQNNENYISKLIFEYE